MSAPGTPGIEDIHPLTPAQAAVLFHCLQHAGSDPGFLQLQCTLAGDLCLTTLRSAIDQVLDRHSALRSSVHWDELEDPVQVVHSRVELTWCSVDLADGSPLDEAARIEALLTADRERGLDLTHPPVLRATAVRLEAARHLLVLSCHHVLLDGWSGDLVLADILETYDHLARGVELDRERPRPFSDYASWLRQQDLAAAQRHWRGVLAGWKPPPGSLVGPTRPASSSGRSPDAVAVQLSAPATADLVALARHRRLTAASLAQAAWALLLSTVEGSDDVVFGVTVSGRGAPVHGIDGTIGMFTNVLPIRVQVAPDELLVEWLDRFHREHNDSRRYEHVHLAQILEWVGSGLRLDSLMVIQRDLPGAPVGRRFPSGLEIEAVRGGFTSSFAVTLLVTIGPVLGLELRYDPARIEPDQARRLLSWVQAILERIAIEAGGTVAAARPRGLRTRQHREGPQLRRHRRSGEHAPRTTLEHTLVQLWEDAIGVAPIGIQDDFFDVGGSSLAALRILAEIEMLTGTKLALTTFFEAPTIGEQAAALATDRWSPRWRSLVPIQRGGSRPALFIINGAQGAYYSRTFRDLARLIGADQPVYGLTANGQARIEDMAADFIAEIRAVQPHGPYLLMGNCAGGLTALEMGHLLHAQGEEVALLALLDPLDPTRARVLRRSPSRLVRSHARKLKRWPARVQRLLGEIRRSGLDVVVDRLRTRTSHGRSQSPALSAKTSRDRVRRAEIEYSFERVVPWRLTVFWAANESRPGSYGSEESLREAWGSRTTGGADIHALPCGHREVLQPPIIEIVAERLRRRIEDAVPGR